MAGLLLLVQLHLCQAEYVLPGGETCFTCPMLSDDHDVSDTAQLASGAHGDCHDCCELRPCEDDGKVKAALAPVSVANLVLALPPALPLAEIPSFEEPRVEFEFLAGCPSTGPPASASPRAPPYSSRV